VIGDLYTFVWDGERLVPEADSILSQTAAESSCRASSDCGV